MINECYSYVPPCIEGMVVTTKKLLGEETVYDECYPHITNRKEIYSNQMDFSCYIHSSLMEIDKFNYKSSRCGEIIQLVGPSNVAVHCQVIGSFSKTNEYSKYIVAPTSFIKKLFSKENDEDEKEYDVPVIMSINAPSFNIFPKLLINVTDRTKPTVVFDVINSNVLIDRISINNKEYHPDRNGEFEVNDEKLLTNVVDLQVLSYDKQIITMKNVDVMSNSNIMLDRKFELTTYPQCNFSSFNSIYDYKEEGTSKFAWSMKQLTGEEYTDLATNEYGKVVKTNDNANATIRLTNQISQRMSLYFNYIEIICVSNSEMSIDSARFIPNLHEYTELIDSNNLPVMQKKDSLPGDMKNKVSAKLFISPRSTSFSLFIL